MPISINYELTGAGWSECEIEIDGRKAKITASYLGDALGDLVRAALRLVRGEHDVTVVSWEEPGKYLWRLAKVDENDLLIQIIESPDWGTKSDTSGVMLLESRCNTIAFANAVLLATQRVFRQHGMEGYKTKWIAHDFPVAEQQELQHLLASKI
jgi:hypothetical protein